MTLAQLFRRIWKPPLALHPSEIHSSVILDETELELQQTVKEKLDALEIELGTISRSQARTREGES